MTKILRNPPITLTTREAAKLLKVTAPFLYNEIKEGRGPPVKRLGRKNRMLRIPYKTLIGWVENAQPSKNNKTHNKRRRAR